MEENELMSDSKRNYYRSVFDKYDRNPKDGFLNIRELKRIINERDRYDNDIPNHVVEQIMSLSDRDGDGKINFSEFLYMVDHPQIGQYFKKYLTNYIKFIVPPKQRQQALRARTLSVGSDADSVDGSGQYEEEYKCWPLPFGMVVISIIEIALFLTDEICKPGSINDGSGPTAQALMFLPYKKEEIWRFVSYMFVHIGYLHLCMNVLIQLVLALPLEMVHGWWRVLSIYFSGVLAGSLFTSVVDPSVLLAGASGGVYAVITAHIASIIMNWSEMSLPLVQLFIFAIITTVDCGASIYNRYFVDSSAEDNKIGYEAHFAGAIAGVMVGIIFLKNLNVRKYENYIWWFSVMFVCLSMSVMMFINVVWYFQ